MGKIIFLDIDGTIRNFDGVIPKSTISAIHQAKENGHAVCICSGRPYNQIEEKVMNIGFDGIISCAGADVVYKDVCISKQYFEEELYLELNEYLLRHGCILELQRSDITYVPEICFEEYVNITKRLMEKNNSSESILKEFPHPVSDWRRITELEKILFLSNELSFDEIKEKWGRKIHMTSFPMPNSERWGGEILPAGVMKTTGIKKILEVSGFSKADVIAVGDSDNDLDMLRFASVGVAMGNATASAKAAADMITDSVMGDGIQKAFTKLGLLSK